VILGLYMLLWGKDRDQQQRKDTKEQDSELDCERQATAVLSEVSAARDDKAPKTKK